MSKFTLKLDKKGRPSNQQLEQEQRLNQVASRFESIDHFTDFVASNLAAGEAADLDVASNVSVNSDAFHDATNEMADNEEQGAGNLQNNANLPNVPANVDQLAQMFMQFMHTAAEEREENKLHLSRLRQQIQDLAELRRDDGADQQEQAEREQRERIKHEREVRHEREQQELLERQDRERSDDTDVKFETRTFPEKSKKRAHAAASTRSKHETRYESSDDEGSVKVVDHQYLYAEPEEDICDQLEREAAEAYHDNPREWGPLKVFGIGRGSFNTPDPPKLDVTFTGPQYEMWYQKWRDHLNTCISEVHPLRVQEFLRSQLNRCLPDSVLTWIANTGNLRNAPPSVITAAIRKRIFTNVNLINSVYNTLIKIQGENQPIDEVINENNLTIRHFLSIHKDPAEAMGMMFLLVRCRSMAFREKLLNKNCKTYDELCHAARNCEKNFQDTAQLHKTASQNIHQIQAAADKASYPAASQTYEGFNVNYVTRGGQHGGRVNGRGRGQGRRGFNRSQSRHRSQSRAPPKAGNGGNGSCNWCGRGRHSRENCPAVNDKCQRCKKGGHFAKVCRAPNPVGDQYGSQQGQRQQGRGRSVEPRRGANSTDQNLDAGQLEQTQTIELVTKDSVTLTEIETNITRDVNSLPKKVVDNSLQPLRTLQVTLASRSGHQAEVEALPDTGANVNVLPRRLANKFGFKSPGDSPNSNGPRCANGSTLKIDGNITTDVVFNDVLYVDVKWHVAECQRVILSHSLITDMGVITSTFPDTSPGDVSMREASAAEIRISNDEEVNNLARKYPNVFCGRVTMMKGTPATIELTPEAQATSAGHFRTIANAYLEPLQRELDVQVRAGILEKLETKPEAAKYWLHPIVVVPKKGTTDIRLCVDFRKLNKYCIRPTNPQKTPHETVRSLPKGERHFAVFDALKGYHQIPLDEQSKIKTAFYTPFGIYCYKSLPMGYAASQDIFTDRFGSAVDDFVQARVTEDCLITATDRQMFLRRIDRFFEACDKAGIVLNTKKVQIGPEVIFGGFKLDSSGYSLDPELHAAIRKFPVPTNLTELRSFMGLINQTTSFTDKIAELAYPLKDLLKKKVDYVWTAAHQEAFERARDQLAELKHLAYFNHRRKTRLFTDASRLNGLGFVVKQQQEDDSWKIVQASSRFLSSAETRYAMVELELLAIAWACQKARPFLEGIHFDLFTDHRPLIPILNDYSLSDVENKRLQRLKMKLSGFTFVAHWIDGKGNVEADALSRAPVAQPEREDEIDENDDATLATSKQAAELINYVEVNNTWEPDTSLPSNFETCIVDRLVDDIREASEFDEEYKIVKNWMIDKIKPSQDSITPRLSTYFNNYEHFSIDKEDMLCYDDRLVVPASLRQRYIDYFVNSHSSVNKIKSRARTTVWWPFMSSDIDQKLRTCRTCEDRKPSVKPEPIHPRDPVQYPFQVLHMDLAAYSGRQFLIMVDQFSMWPIVRNMGKDTTTSDVTALLVKVFNTFGIPEQIFSDGGPQFRSQEFINFCKEWRIDPQTSSPHYPQSNGIAENAVKAMKRLIHCTFDVKKGGVKPDEWTKAILLYKNTPRGPSKLSPAEILFGRILRDGVPASRLHYLPQHAAAIQRRYDEQQRYTEGKLKCDDVATTRRFEVGDRVYVKDYRTNRWTGNGCISGLGMNNREFWVTMDSGAVYRRNRSFLRHAKDVQPTPTPTRTPQDKPKGPNTTPNAGRRVRFENEAKIDTRRSTRTTKPPERFQPGTAKPIRRR